MSEKLYVNANGNLLIADRNNSRVREITFSTGIIETLIGSGASGSTGDGQPARGVHLILSAPGFVTKRVPVDIDQSAWEIFSLGIAQTLGVPFAFSVRE